jgi:hypothetical protein
MAYYIDTDNFSTATAVWTDSILTIKASDGYYSFTGSYRQQLDGFLLELMECPTIPPIPCIEYMVQTDEFPATLEYNDCNGLPVSMNLTSFQTINVCAQEGTIFATGAIISLIGIC